MKKNWLLVPLALLLAAMLGACGVTSEVDLSNTIDAPDGSVSIDTPSDWSEDTTQTLEGYLVLSIYDGNGAFAHVFFYPDDGSGDTAEDYANLLIENYYTDNIIGEVQETKLGENDAYYFEYSMVDQGVDDNNYNYHGYEYVVSFGADIVEIDINYSQETLESKIFKPSEDQLELLRRIAETVRINK